MFAGFLGAVSVGICKITGSLTKSAAPSGGIVTSDTVTINVPLGNSGGLSFDGLSITGTVTTEYSKNGGAFTALADGSTITFANGDTLAVRGTGMVAGEAWSCGISNRSTAIGNISITAV